MRHVVNIIFDTVYITLIYQYCILVILLLIFSRYVLKHGNPLSVTVFKPSLQQTKVAKTIAFYK